MLSVVWLTSAVHVCLCHAAPCRYYEPLAAELAGVEQLLAGPAVRKLLFMSQPELVAGLVEPHWRQALQGQGAEVMQAVPNMLEVVPAGVNKWAGLQVRLRLPYNCCCCYCYYCGEAVGCAWVS